MRKIKTWRDPFDEGFSSTRPREITINEGLTVLVGCNGAGKTTLLQNIREVLKGEKVPFFKYDNLTDGGGHGLEAALYENDLATFATGWCSSEGENISINMLRCVAKFKEFIETGKIKPRIDWWDGIFGVKKDETPVPQERWFLLDAVDSGYSIDNVVDLKHLFNEIIKDCKGRGLTCYIVVAANEYELANGEDCFDVNTGKYIRFEGYEDFRQFIFKSRIKKDKRIQRLKEKKGKSKNGENAV